MQNVPYLAPHMLPWLILIAIMVVCGTGFLADRITTRAGEVTSSAPDIYTAENVRIGGQYHVEQDGKTQDFEVLDMHRSGYFQVCVAPPEGHELNRDYEAITGWTREILSNRLIESGHLLAELPVECCFATN